MLFLIFTAVVVVIAYVLHTRLRPSLLKIKGAHVLITGGSSGIGRALAVQVAKQGGDVTLLARNEDKLRETAAVVKDSMLFPSKQRVIYIPCDVAGKCEDVEKAINQAVETHGPIDILINNAGISAALPFEDTSVEEFQKLMDVNYIGSVKVTKAAISGMKAHNKGRIVFVSSQAGQLGVFGYTAYSPTKYALRGLAESLQMEMKPYNIYVTVSFPPDTDTPGFREEMEGNKPEETKQISATSGMFNAGDVAKQILCDTQAGHHLSYNGLDGWMLATITCGMTPATSLFEVIQQGLLMGILRIIGLFYLASFDSIINRCKRQRERENKSQ